MLLRLPSGNEEEIYTPNYMYVGSEPSWSDGLKPPKYGIPQFIVYKCQFWQVSFGLNKII